MNLTPLPYDPDDDHVIACAIAAKADAIISRHGDLPRLASYQASTSLTQQALDRIEHAAQ